jgi:hypothetical protein
MERASIPVHLMLAWMLYENHEPLRAVDLRPRIRSMLHVLSSKLRSQPPFRGVSTVESIRACIPYFSGLGLVCQRML